MISLCPNLSPSSPLLSVNSFRFSSSVSNFRPRNYLQTKKPNHRRIRNGTCRSELSHDAPFAAAIGACILSSLVLPVSSGPDDDGESVIDSTDSRFAVMGIISFIPYFNWLSWVFAWLDTGKRRYVVYSIVYLVPYLRSNLSLSPEESWLPIASIVFCIIHIQLEASIRNGDVQGFQLFSEATKHFSSKTRKGHTQGKDDEGFLDEEKIKRDMELPSAGEDEIQRWGVPRKPYNDREQLNSDWDDNETRKH